ncbi:MAG: extracellular solute-binding protein [Lachnospiraceae bacterium]|nr:extracellular solute-binding protein [Lachnospiraceae bacterium]
MKRCRISIITMVGILGLFLCGCGSGKEEQDLKAEGELTFYCMEDDERAALYMFEFKSRYPNITVNRVTFDDSSKMDDKVKTELNAGTGPDVILFSSKNSLDVLDMAKQGAFLALNEEMAEDKLLEEDDYLPGTFEAGKVDGKVYALPITFSIPFLTYDKTEELGFEPGPVISFEEYCEAIAEDIERLKGDDTHRTLYCQRYFRSLLGAAQVYAVSVEDQSVTIDAEGLKKTIDEIARFEDGVEEANTFMERYVKIEPELPGHFTFLYHVYSDVTQAVCLWENLYRADGIKEMGLSVIGNADGSGVSAIAESYGVVTANAMPYAYEFLRAAMDVSPTATSLDQYEMSLKKSKIEEQIDGNRDAKGTYQSVQISGLSKEMAEQLTEVYNSITEVVIMNPVVRSMCRESFNPYMREGSKTYEECYNEFEQKLNLYAGE